MAAYDLLLMLMEKRLMKNGIGIGIRKRRNLPIHSDSLLKNSGTIL